MNTLFIVKAAVSIKFQYYCKSTMQILFEIVKRERSERGANEFKALKTMNM